MDLETLLELELNLNSMGLSGIHHTHVADEWMVGYQSMFMSMDGNLDGTSRLSDADVLSQFMVTPTDMDMQMHMFEIMYAPSNDWTYMLMVPYIRSSMNHRTMGGVRFKTNSEGMGDIKLSGLYNFWRRDREERTERLVAKFGVGLPTGSINEKDDTPMGRVTLPYPMQRGSGTVDLRPGLTYLSQTPQWALGSHLGAVLASYQNRRDYQLGNRGNLSLWAAYKLASWLSASLRVDGHAWGNIHGSDDRLNPAMVPTADPDRRAGKRVDLLLGFNLFGTSGVLRGHRIAVEAGVPIYQNLDGPQLQTDWRATLSWNFTR
jgi:hypothetical protein